MSVHVDWGALGLVSLVSFGAAVGLIILFALGVSALAAPAAEPSSHLGATGHDGGRPAWSWPVAAVCFLTCALVVAYGLYLIIA
ncbi:MAG: hypothetical protein ACRDSH_13410 [Pseudonocardiaceae bacterium]